MVNSYAVVFAFEHLRQDELRTEDVQARDRDTAIVKATVQLWVKESSLFVYSKGYTVGVVRLTAREER